MLTTIGERDGERVLTLCIDEATIDAELMAQVESVLADSMDPGAEIVVFHFTGRADSVAGGFPTWPSARAQRHALFRSLGSGPGPDIPAAG
jgi:hypothetical protein